MHSHKHVLWHNALPDERLLSFIVVTMDVNQRLLTARECLWNTENKTSIQWGSSCTITF